MPEGDELAFDYWLLPASAGAVSALHNGVTLEEVRTSPFFRSRLTPDELRILDSVRVITAEANPGLAADAPPAASGYWVRISNGYSYLISEIAHLLASYEGQTRALEDALMLLLASEYEALSTDRRWYWAPTVDWYQTLSGRPPVPNPDNESYAIKAMTRALILHELCHHFRGHTSPEVVARMASLSGPSWTAQSHANELEADVCAAQHIAAGGSDPRLDLVFLQMVWLLKSTDASVSHPAVRARLTAVAEVTRASGVTDYLEPELAVQSEELFDQILNYAAATRRADELIAGLPRGTWPACPMNPQRRCR